jgi:CRISPR-associated helicase Cas3/CRISPR-associated endonuclease Cas3-HD
MMKLSAYSDHNGDAYGKDSNNGMDNEDEYLSHPIEEPRHSLLQHSIYVAQRTRELLSYTRFRNSELGFFSGLLHDIGKLNPYYQILFRTDKLKREAVQRELIQRYEPSHSPYSAWIADKLLNKMAKHIDYVLLDKIVTLIYGHHSKLHGSIGEAEFMKSEKFKATQQEMIKDLERFHHLSSRRLEFSQLSWNNFVANFLDPISFEIEIRSNSNDAVNDFLELSVAFSCLLQADRGSFSDHNQANFNLEMDTSKLINIGSKLSSIRDTIQKQLLSRFELDEPVVIINAPTGSGKTKIFLDLINRYKSNYKNLERVFYFSPLLALTEDFEQKLAKTVNDVNEVLIYNHLFSGSIEEKRSFESSQVYDSQWIFDNESFNRPFIITTTQRLLITIFSNKQSDKLKLASFRNSLLIIDEVQTIPKYILGSLVHILKSMYEFLGTRTILVSATIPYELQSIPTTKPSLETSKSYLDLTKKYISFQPWSTANVEIKKGRTLVMANTRRKAANIFNFVNHRFPDTLYLSSGVRKRDKIKILSQLHQNERSDDHFILVSTQVVEAGVDLSFSQVFREKAPLDSIIQVMGRLNREAEDDQAKLIVYEYDGKYQPYSELELNESEKILKWAKDSTELYSSLPQYYKSISEKNNLYKDHSKQLGDLIAKLDFDGIWEFINNHVLDNTLENERDTVLIPDIQEWDGIKKLLMKKKLTKTDYRTFSNISASLPRKVYNLGIEDYFDGDD